MMKSILYPSFFSWRSIRNVFFHEPVLCFTLNLGTNKSQSCGALVALWSPLKSHEIEAHMPTTLVNSSKQED